MFGEETSGMCVCVISGEGGSGIRRVYEQGTGVGLEGKMFGDRADVQSGTRCLS